MRGRVSGEARLFVLCVWCGLCVSCARCHAHTFVHGRTVSLCATFSNGNASRNLIA